ncbi:MAG: response regulator transcription factor [Acidimicrobiia bacterium]
MDALLVDQRPFAVAVPGERWVDPGRPTEEELTVMRMVAEGVKDCTIARRLGVSVVTVRRRAQKFRQRVGAKTRVEAVALAVRDGLIQVKGSDDSSDR